MTENQMILRALFPQGTMAAGDVGHTFESAEWKAWQQKFPASMYWGCARTMAAGSSSLYRHLLTHPHCGSQLLAEAAADVTQRLRTGRETAEDGDELAEVCFRAAGRAGVRTRDEQLGLAAALLAHLAGRLADSEGVTRCGSCDAPAFHDLWPSATPFFMRPAVVRTVAR